MISVRRVEDVTVDFAEVVRRSPVAEQPRALEHLLSFTKSSAYTYVGFIDGKVACIYGLMPPTLMSNRAYLWLLTTETATEHKFIFIRHSQLCVEAILREFDVIIGETNPQDARAMRWMRWLGATFEYTGKPLIPFCITRESFEARYG